MLIESSLIIIGFVLLIKGASFFVDGAVQLAYKLNLGIGFIGITLVALGTSIPELFVNILAARDNLNDVAIGNILGSNLFNLLLVLGLLLTLVPITNISKTTIIEEIPFSLLILWFFFTFVNDNFFMSFFGKEAVDQLVFYEGIVLLSLVLLFLYRLYKQHTLTKLETEKSTTSTISNLRLSIYIVLGILGLYLGSELVLNNSVRVAKRLNLSEAFIGVFILAVGTSLPELITSLVSIAKKHHHLALGNIIGSNIINVGFVLGIVSLSKKIKYNHAFDLSIIVISFITLLIFFILFFKKEKKLTRKTGIFLLVGYLVYSTYSFLKL